MLMSHPIQAGLSPMLACRSFSGAWTPSGRVPFGVMRLVCFGLAMANQGTRHPNTGPIDGPQPKRAPARNGLPVWQGS